MEIKINIEAGIYQNFQFSVSFNLNLKNDYFYCFTTYNLKELSFLIVLYGYRIIDVLASRFLSTDLS